MTPIATSPDGQRGRAAYRVYLAANAATFFALHTVYTMAAVYYVRVVGMSPLQLVLVGTALEVGYFAFEVPTGVVADAYSRKWSVIAGTALLGAGFIVQGVVPVFAVIAAAEMVKGVAHTFISGSWEAWIADEIGEERARRAYLRGAQFSTLGGLGGTLAGAGLATLRLDLPIVTGGCLMLVLAAGLVLLMPEHGFRPAPREERGSWAQMAHIARKGLRVVRGRPVLTGLVAVTFVEGAFSEGLDRLWEAHLLTNVSLPSLGSVDSVFWFGLINAAGMVLSLAGTEVARRRLGGAGQRPTARALLVLTVVLTASVAVFGLARSFALALTARLAASVCRAVMDPLYVGWLNRDLDPSVRATVISMGGQANALGQIAGGPAVGALGSALSLRAALLASAALLTPAVAIYARLQRLVREVSV